MDTRSAAGYFSASAPAVRVLLMLLLLALVAQSLAALVWRVLAPEAPLPTLTAPSAADAPRAAGGDGQRLERLRALNLFGAPEQAEAQTAPAAPIDAPETRLALELRGVFLGDTPSESYAIIKSGNDENFYPVGAEVADGVELYQVEVDRVLLKRGERFERLSLPRESVAGGGAERSENSGTAADAGAELLRYREALKSDPRKLYGLARAIPVLERGSLVGYRLLPGREAGLLQRFGLQSGDVVTAVNGISLNNPMAVGKVLSELADAEHLQVTVQRQGRPVTLDFDMQG